MTPEFTRLNVCLNCGGVLLEDGSCSRCGWGKQDPDWYDDRFDPSAQAWQTVDQIGANWADHAGEMEMNETQQEIYNHILENNEFLKFDVERLVKDSEEKDTVIQLVLDVLEKSKYVVGTISWIASFLFFFRSVFLPVWEPASAAFYSLIIATIIGYLMGFPGYKLLLEKLLSFKPPSPPSSD